LKIILSARHNVLIRQYANAVINLPKQYSYNQRIAKYHEQVHKKNHTKIILIIKFCHICKNENVFFFEVILNKLIIYKYQSCTHSEILT
jgi:hypothetical protein